MKKNVGKVILALALALVMVVGVVSPVAAKPVRTFTIDSMELVDHTNPYQLHFEASFDNWGAWGYTYLLRKDSGSGFQSVGSAGPYMFSAGRLTSGYINHYGLTGLTPGLYELTLWLVGHNGRPIKRIGYKVFVATLSEPT